MQSNHKRLVESLMIEYGAWSRIHSGMVKGYPHQTSFRALLGGGVASTRMNDDGAQLMEAALKKLFEIFPEQQETLVRHYVKQESKGDIGRDLGKCSTSMRHYMDLCLNSLEVLLDPSIIY